MELLKSSDNGQELTNKQIDFLLILGIFFIDKENMKDLYEIQTINSNDIYNSLQFIQKNNLIDNFVNYVREEYNKKCWNAWNDTSLENYTGQIIDFI